MNSEATDDANKPLVDGVQSVDSDATLVILSTSNAESPADEDAVDSTDPSTLLKTLKVDEDVLSQSSVGLSDAMSPIHGDRLVHSVSADVFDSPRRLASEALQLSCEMCANYETKLQQLQEMERSLKQQLAAAHHLSDRYHTELSGERLYRNELEAKMAVLSKEAQDQVRVAIDASTANEARIGAAIDEYTKRLNADKVEFDALREHAAHIERQAAEANNKYNKLLGAHRSKSSDMRAEAIELPQTVDELQLMCLQLREELIETRAAKEHVEETFKGDVGLLKEAIVAEQENKQRLEENLMEEVNQLRTELGITQSKVTSLLSAEQRAEEVEKRMAEFQTTIDDLETRLGTLQTERGELEFDLKESKRRCHTLQQELDTSEVVQRDFVKLSQSLQIELEKIRQAEQEVRWQFDEDVYLCNGCKEPFTKTRVRQHCRHCGRIFCEPCLPKNVPSGPQKRLAKVCDVCHTLLVRNINCVGDVSDIAVWRAEVAAVGSATLLLDDVKPCLPISAVFDQKLKRGSVDVTLQIPSETSDKRHSLAAIIAQLDWWYQTV
uniref:FYVE-type domain-containing protein n=1 Tax=Plectus sambesii TaxID=2011161 RepID=A0A914VXL3_9BILA